MKRIELNGEWFEVSRSKYTESRVDALLNRYAGLRLEHWYENPSNYKINVHDEWVDWFYDTPQATRMGVTSANCHTFTIGGLYIDPETMEILGYIQITKDHNRIYLYK